MPHLRLRRLAIVAALSVLTPWAQSAVLTFDDLPADLAFFTADYQGFRFGTNDIATTAWFYTTELDPPYAPRSPRTYISTDFTLYTGAPFEAAQAIRSSVDFVFDGAYFSGFDRIRYALYNDGALVFTSADSDELTNTPTFHASGYGGRVDEVVILGRQGFFALDDFTYNSGSTVPEPGSLTLALLAAASGVVASRRWAAAKSSA